MHEVKERSAVTQTSRPKGTVGWGEAIDLQGKAKGLRRGDMWLESPAANITTRVKFAGCSDANTCRCGADELSLI